MITRSHIKDDAPSVAVYSDCERYRYALTRVWELQGRRLSFVMLNPSTATEVQNDPTVERCERRARALGFTRASPKGPGLGQNRSLPSRLPKVPQRMTAAHIPVDQ